MNCFLALCRQCKRWWPSIVAQCFIPVSKDAGEPVLKQHQVLLRSTQETGLVGTPYVPGLVNDARTGLLPRMCARHESITPLVLTKFSKETRCLWKEQVVNHHLKGGQGNHSITSCLSLSGRTSQCDSVDAQRDQDEIAEIVSSHQRAHP